MYISSFADKDANQCRATMLEINLIVPPLVVFPPSGLLVCLVIRVYVCICIVSGLSANALRKKKLVILYPLAGTSLSECKTQLCSCSWNASRQAHVPVRSSSYRQTWLCPARQAEGWATVMFFVNVAAMHAIQTV